MPDVAVFVLLFIALALGYVLGRVQPFSKKSPLKIEGRLPRKNYYHGLNQLLNDQPDAAIDTFISALEVNSETLETHLALGSLLRRRGETTRAIRVHQNLLARPSLSRAQLHLAQLELGVDFLKAGLLDRAESLFKELADTKNIDKKTREQALGHLIEVYQDTSDWLDAIDVADRLTTRKFGNTPDKWRASQAQFSCELAEEALAKNDLLEARRLLRNAQRYDKHCARAVLLQARIELNDQTPAVALALLRKIPYQSPQHTSEALPLIRECFEQLKSAKGAESLLREIYTAQPSLTTLNYLAEAVEQEQGCDAVVELLLQELPAFPQMEAAADLLKLVASDTENLHYSTIKSVLEKLIKTHATYICTHCGFEAWKNHWLCPRCKSWGTIALQ